jgi:hypothetical protein
MRGPEAREGGETRTERVTTKVDLTAAVKEREPPEQTLNTRRPTSFPLQPTAEKLNCPARLS